MHRVFIVGAAAVVALTSRPAAGQMVSSATERAKYDTTVDMPDSVASNADVDAIAGKYRPTVKNDEFDKSRITYVVLGQWFGGPGNRRLKTKCTGGGVVAEVDDFKVAKFER